MAHATVEIKTNKSIALYDAETGDKVVLDPEHAVEYAKALEESWDARHEGFVEYLGRRVYAY